MTEPAIRRFHKAIIKTAMDILGRKLTERERKFITSRKGFVALEMIHDYIRGEAKETVERYLNSE